MEGGQGCASDGDALMEHVTEFEREAREVPEEYYEGLVTGPEADREVAELAHLSEIGRVMARRAKP
jgi:hypothetical protein